MCGCMSVKQLINCFKLSYTNAQLYTPPPPHRLCKTTYFTSLTLLQFHTFIMKELGEDEKQSLH